jgi:hypothetical protein
MRALRGTAATILVGIVLVLPATANADGGAFISFTKTHNIVGTVAEGEGYIYVPAKHQDLLERGPFYAYLVNATGGQDLRVATVAFEPYGKTEFELRFSFTVPDVPTDYYTVRICNEPCTVSGFREPLTGPISIVHTEDEAALLTENTKLGYRNYSLQRKVRKGERTIEELESELAAAHASLDAATPVVEPSPAAVAPLRTVVEADDRPLVDAWALFGLGGALLVAIACVGVALAFSRGSRTHDPLPAK